MPLGRRLAYFSPLLLALVFLATLPLFLRMDFVTLFTKIIIFALLAMSLDLIFGYSGLWCFGQAGLFGAAAYTVAILIKADVTSFWVVAPCAVGVAVVTAALFGVFGLRSREIYFMLITFAFGQLIYVGVYTTTKYTGGSNGLANIPLPDLGFGPPLSSRSFYYLVLLVVIICALVLQRIIKSPFGYSLMGIRDNEVRAKALGYSTWRRRFIAFLVSGFFAGVAGVLYVYYRMGISPTDVGIDVSGIVIMMVIVGGVGTLWGGAIGAVLILFLQYYISLYVQARWPLIVGVLFIAAVFLAGDGIFPLLTKFWKWVCWYPYRELWGRINRWARHECLPSGDGPIQQTKVEGETKRGGDTYQGLVTLWKRVGGSKANESGRAEQGPDTHSSDD